MISTSFTRRCIFVSFSYLSSLALVLALSGSCEGSPEERIIDFVGTMVLRDSVDAYSTDVWALRLRAFRPVEVRVQTRGTVGLTCAFAGPKNETIAANQEDSCRIVFTPKQTGAYHLEITNPNGATRSYAVLLK